ncbi:MAG: hypothetical protein WB774_13270 [Xanthobacteraceae bacterium]|jgi:serine/threonine-protein kinase HipA
MVLFIEIADREPLPDEVRDPSPIAGVQRKIALARLGSGFFGLPKSGLRVPTTHILKVPKRNKGREARLEAAALQLAREVFLEAAVQQVLKVAGISNCYAVLTLRLNRLHLKG